MNKSLFIVDRPYLTDKANIRNTEIVCKDEIGNVMWVTRNKVIAPGSLFTMSKHFNSPLPITLPNYNDALSLDESESDTNLEYKPEQKVYLFAVSNDGVGAEDSQKLDVNYKCWTKPEDLIPFRYVPNSSDISLEERQMYYGKKTGDTHIAYYFKAFESEPTSHAEYLDGTPVDNNLYDSTNDQEIQIYEELKLKITKEDLREWFNIFASPVTSKISSFMLLTAYPVEIGGVIYYQNIQPITKFNIKAEDMDDDTKGLDITYHIYY